MLGVTIFGLFLTPAFFVVLRSRRKTAAITPSGDVISNEDAVA
jgi:hypothetical protein